MWPKDTPGVVDLDLEKFFDRVNHDRLMAAGARRVSDKRMLQAQGQCGKERGGTAGEA